MTTPKIVTGFSRYKDLDMVTKANYIYTCMYNNVNFTDPKPLLADLKTTINNFEMSMVEAISGNKSETAKKNSLRLELEGLLNNLSYYVQTNGKNLESILLSSGFDIKKRNAKVGMLLKPTHFMVAPGSGTGSVRVSLKPIVRAMSYIFEYTEMPNTESSVWVAKPSTKTYLIINGLVSGKQYAFKVAGVGSNVSQVFSDIVLSFIL